MGDLRNYHAIEQLKNGMTVTVRAIKPDDKDKLLEAFRNLEKESIYTRFFMAKGELTDSDLKYATEVDFENAVALVVTKVEGQNETIIGAGRYVAYDVPGGSRCAEVAFMVEEDYNGLGIASRILRHLTGIARDKGIATFEAEVLAGNKAMLNVFTRCGLPITQGVEGKVAHVTLELGGVS
jgi:RimJ/RimL family protein N-acetyltransferase